MAKAETGDATEYDTSAEDALTAAMEDAWYGPYYEPAPTPEPEPQPAEEEAGVEEPELPSAPSEPEPGAPEPTAEPGAPAAPPAEPPPAERPGPTPSAMRVTARIEWAGADTGVRTTRFDGLRLDGVVDAMDRARAAEHQAQQARPATSYTATGWHAQIRALTEHSRGSECADRAGLAPSAQTLHRWLAEEQAPSAANREKIANAYTALRTNRVDRAREQGQAWRHEVVDELTSALRDRYGAEIRIRDIRNLRFD